MVECPLLVMLAAAIALAFTTLFALAVSIDRFSQLGVVRQSVGLTTVPGIEWFLAYGTNSVMRGNGSLERAVRVLAIV